MERALWCLSANSRESLVAGESAPVLEELVWTIRIWWGVVGVPKEAKPKMARALAELTAWSPELFESKLDYGPGAARDACKWVDELVSRSRSLGVRRREYSWASKVLHWLMPWRVPAFDRQVCELLGVPKKWDLPQAYRKVTMDVFEMARMTAGECNWIGELEPRSQLRALDKYIWWTSAGGPGNARVVRQPCQVLRRLGLKCVTGYCDDGQGIRG
jgi:hypothetical protein